MILRQKKSRIEGRNQMHIRKFVKEGSLKVPTPSADEQGPNVASP